LSLKRLDDFDRWCTPPLRISGERATVFRTRNTVRLVMLALRVGFNLPNLLIGGKR
jgi:hypothetical protein